MKKSHLPTLVGLVTATSLLPLAWSPQEPDRDMTAAQLKEMVVNLGYEVTDINKEAGKEKVSTKINKGALDIPVGIEMSPSKRFIWLTVNLGDFDALPQGPDRAVRMLKANTKMQPSQFYISDSGKIMMALAVDNRALTPSALRFRIEKVTQDVVDTKETWQKPK